MGVPSLVWNYEYELLFNMLVFSDLNSIEHNGREGNTSALQFLPF